MNIYFDMFNYMADVSSERIIFTAPRVHCTCGVDWGTGKHDLAIYWRKTG